MSLGALRLYTDTDADPRELPTLLVSDDAFCLEVLDSSEGQWPELGLWGYVLETNCPFRCTVPGVVISCALAAEVGRSSLSLRTRPPSTAGTAAKRNRPGIGSAMATRKFIVDFGLEYKEAGTRIQPFPWGRLLQILSNWASVGRMRQGPIPDVTLIRF